jgi:hypothetical protein
LTWKFKIQVINIYFTGEKVGDFSVGATFLMISSVVGKFSGSERILSRLERFSSPLSTSCTRRKHIPTEQHNGVLSLLDKKQIKNGGRNHVAGTFIFCQVNNAVVTP